MLPLALLLLTAPAEPGPTVSRFIHLIAGAPVGEVELQREGPRYTYLSRHFFRRGKTSQERFEPAPAKGEAQVWASESLLTFHQPGCWQVEDEQTLEHGENCVDKPRKASTPVTSGTTMGRRFTARYASGRLQELVVGDSRFVRSDEAVEFSDPFGEGFAIEGDGPALGLRPPMRGTRMSAPVGVGSEEDCLVAARAYAKSNGAQWEVVLGLVEADGRGWPHAWVRHRSSGEERDPSRQTGGAYLALPAERVASVYLELLGKRRALVRVAGK